MQTTLQQLDAASLADATRDCRKAVQTAVGHCFAAERRRKGAPSAPSVDTAPLQSAYDAHARCVAAEVAASAQGPVPKRPKPVVHSAAERARLSARACVRLAVGVPLGMAYTAIGPAIYPESARENLRHFALHTCCAGGACDIKRANAPASKGLKWKRAYQLRQAEHTGYMAGHFGAD